MAWLVHQDLEGEAWKWEDNEIWERALWVDPQGTKGKDFCFTH